MNPFKAKQKAKPAPAPALDPHPGDALVNGTFDFPMSGDGTEDKAATPPDVFLNSEDTFGTMG